MLNVKLQNRGRRRKKQSLGPSSVALLFLASAACDKDPFSPLPASLTTDASAYSAAPGPSFGAWREYTVTITARFTNASPYTVHIARCASSTRYPIYSILHVGSAEVAAYNPGWACVGGYYVHVAPGATRTDTLPISAPWGVDGNTAIPMGVFEGSFVLEYEMYGCADETPACTKPVYGSARSGVFAIRKGS